MAYESMSQSLRHMTEIMSHRRSANSSEEMLELVSNRIKQDLLINHLKAKIASRRCQIEVQLKVQLKAQKEETLSAREILRELLAEMELI